jgi:hypothetical protein
MRNSAGKDARSKGKPVEAGLPAAMLVSMLDARNSTPEKHGMIDVSSPEEGILELRAS